METRNTSLVEGKLYETKKMRKGGDRYKIELELRLK